MPGRKTSLTRFPLIAATTSGSCAHSAMAPIRPPRMTEIASAVPHAPAPTTARRSNGLAAETVIAGIIEGGMAGRKSRHGGGLLANGFSGIVARGGEATAFRDAAV